LFTLSALYRSIVTNRDAADRADVGRRPQAATQAQWQVIAKKKKVQAFLLALWAPLWEQGVVLATPLRLTAGVVQAAEVPASGPRPTSLAELQSGVVGAAAVPASSSSHLSAQMEMIGATVCVFLTWMQYF
jgi:hypothetical protein